MTNLDLQLMFRVCRRVETGDIDLLLSTSVEDLCLDVDRSEGEGVP